MGKIARNIIILLFTTIIIAGSVIGYFYYNKKEIVITQLLKGVPTDAALIFECKNTHSFFTHLKEGTNVWSLLTQVEEFENLNLQINWLDSIIVKNKELLDVVNRGPLIVSLHKSGKKSFQVLYLINFGSFITEEKVKSFFIQEFGDSTSFSERIYNETTLYETKTDKGNAGSSVHWAMPKGVFIISESSLIVEDAIRQLESDYSLLDNVGFRKVLETSGKNVDANIYIQHNLFPKFISNFISSNYQKSTQNLKNIADWSEIDFHIKPDMFMFNGFTNTGDSLPNYMNTFLHQKPQEFTAAKILPGDVFSFLYLGINDIPAYLSDYRKYLDGVGKLNEYNKQTSKLNNTYNIDLDNLFNDIIDGEVVMAFADNQLFSLDSIKEEYLFIKTKSHSLIKEKMNNLLLQISKTEKKELNKYQSTCTIDAETSFQIFSFPIQNLGELTFGGTFGRILTSYFMYLDDYIVFSSSKNALKNLYHSNLLQKTLENDAFYKNYTENLDSKCNFLFYIDLSRAKDFASGFMNNEIAKSFNQNFEVFQRLDAISCQMSLSRGMIYNSIIVRYNPEIKERTHTIWESRLDSTLSKKPFLLLNHITNEKEIFIQDDGNTIYLLNSTGRILWKNHIPESIISDIYQVDVYKNKKLQYLFSTRNYIYIIDRDGNYLDRYPIKLQSPATNGISICDFDNNGEVRIYIACSDKKVYCYSLDGNIVKGWEFETTDNYVYSPFLFFTTNKKDYIVFADTLKCYVLDRKGSYRFKLNDFIARNRESRFFFEPKNPETEDRIVTNALDGTIIYIYLDGSIKKKSFGTFASQHYFEFKDMDVDGYCDYIFLDEENLSIFNKLKKKMCSYDFSEIPTYRPVFYEFPGGKKNKIGVVCGSENKVYMIDREGKLPKGFPLEGCTPFSISHFEAGKRNYNLIVGSKDGFLYNYEVY